MSAVRDLLSYLALALAVMAAIPAVLALRVLVWSLSIAIVDAGPFADETQKVAAKFLTDGQPAVAWLGVAALLFTNFILIRIWNAVANL